MSTGTLLELADGRWLARVDSDHRAFFETFPSGSRAEAIQEAERLVGVLDWAPIVWAVKAIASPTTPAVSEEPMSEMCAHVSDTPAAIA